MYFHSLAKRCVLLGLHMKPVCICMYDTKKKPLGPLAVAKQNYDHAKGKFRGQSNSQLASRLLREANSCPRGQSISNYRQQLYTLMPAERHLATASGTAALGGSIIDMRPTKRSPVNGKFSASESNTYDDGYLQTSTTSLLTLSLALLRRGHTCNTILINITVTLLWTCHVLLYFILLLFGLLVVHFQ